MRERTDASYHPATFQAPNLRDIKSFSFPLNYTTGEPAPIVKKAREKQRPEDASDRKDNANKKKAPKISDANDRGSSRDKDGIDRIDHAVYNKKVPKTSDAHTRGISRNDGVSTTNHPAKNTKKKTDKKGRDSAGEKKGSRFGGALSDLKSRVMRGGSRSRSSQPAKNTITPVHEPGATAAITEQKSLEHMITSEVMAILTDGSDGLHIQETESSSDDSES
ncbi:hypothetical protein BPAE_0044g00200 [Botrytis paeoniae]|uniref:Uncharacterized protein n=1 Tax=Botrytis paeoniae TaxID=278948 RepID=A0A4Z1FRZ4_9HELO|nr:hypothetical protein BPAE_0044g00200 [Botrytis paeoniae]